MPQNPTGAYVAKNSSNTLVPLNVDDSGNLRVATATEEAPAQSRLNITVATVVKATPGTIIQLNVVVAGSTTGTVNDCATTGAVAAANEIAVLPDTVGTVVQNWPCTTGIVVTPGTGQTLSIAFR
jgi:hypothetical protein